MKLVIEQIAGAWKIEVNGRSEFADTLEQLIEKADPGAPLDYVMHTTNILSGVLGIEYQPDYVPIDDDYEIPQALVDAFFGQADSPDHWEPTEEQEAYFQPERTEETDEFARENKESVDDLWGAAKDDGLI